MKKPLPDFVGDDADSRLAHLEILVDELIKDSPQESRVRAFMEAAGLDYSKDPIERMNKVLSALDGARKSFGRGTPGRTKDL